MKDTATQVLKDFKLRVTSPRLSILAIFLPHPSKAFSKQHLMQVLEKKMNRSTIYRTIEILTKQQVINKMTYPNGEIIYSLHGAKKCNHRTHPHLKCTSCGAVKCLPNYPIPYINELTASGVQEMNIVLSGVCKSCTNSS